MEHKSNLVQTVQRVGTAGGGVLGSSERIRRRREAARGVIAVVFILFGDAFSLLKAPSRTFDFSTL